MTAYIELPESYPVDDIDESSITLSIDGNDFGAIESIKEIGDHDENGINDLMVKFDRQAIISMFKEGLFDLTISGLVNGSQFEGVDTIRVINKGK
jgi:hypothetical protein